jgi:putative membrane-bound dehydrogenase-like protein
MLCRFFPFLAVLPAVARPPAAEDFVLHPACRIELWAAEPDIVDPVGLTFDAAGRAYVLEMRDYPYGMDGKGAPGGTVRRLEDTNGDGRPDKSDLFAENLSFPTSIAAVKDGVVVSAPPEIVFLADRDGDGKAEVREVWFTGFVKSVTDSNFSGLRWHIDGRIHGVNGGNGGIIRSPKRPEWSLALGNADFAFDPETFEFALTYPASGGFGLAFDDAGRSFVTHNVNHLQMRILPQSVLDEVPGGSPLAGTQNISVHGENCRIFAVAEAQTRPNHPEQAGYFSSAGGMGFLGHSGWPGDLPGSVFVCDAASGIVHREILSPDGPILKAQRSPDEQASEFLAGRDPAFRPVGVELGPDGALYVIDMQRDVIEHPDYIPPRMKAKIDVRAGSDRGRIWRLVPKAGLPKPDKLPAQCSAEERVALLGSPNQWTRLTAQRLLIEQPNESAIPILEATLGLGSRRDDTRKPPVSAREPYSPLHALWILAAFKKLDRLDFFAATENKSPLVRAALLQSLPRFGLQHSARVMDAPWQTAEPWVLWHHLLMGRELSSFDIGSEKAAFAKISLQALDRFGEDKWMRAAALRLLDDRSDQAVPLIQSGKCSNPDALHDIARAQKKSLPLQMLLVKARDLGPEHLSAATAGALVSIKSHDLLPEIPDEWLESKEPTVLDAALQLEEAGAILENKSNREALLAGVLESSASSQSIPVKAKWLRLLRHFPLTKTADTLFAALHAGEPPEVQQAALECLRSRKETEVAERIVRDWPSISPALRPALAARMVDVGDFRLILANALVSGAIKPGEITLDLEQRRELLRHSGAEVKEKVSRFLTDDEYSNRGAVVDEWLAKLPAAGDAERGKAVYARQCAQCHRAGGSGFEVGPDLAGQSHRSVEDLLCHIVDPDMAIHPNYAAFLAETTDGEKHAGLLVRSGATVVLRQAMGVQVEIPREKLKSLQSTGHSLMPAGQEAAFTPQEMRDLIAFLQRRD